MRMLVSVNVEGGGVSQFAQMVPSYACCLDEIIKNSPFHSQNVPVWMIDLITVSFKMQYE